MSVRRLLRLGAIGVVAFAAGCPSNGGGGITIQSPDGSNPSITLSAALGSQSATVQDGGAAASLTLAAKSGSLNLVATGKDNESGLKDVQIWVNSQTSTCSGGTCTTTGGGLLGVPRFSAPGANKTPGDMTAPTSILADAIDLTKEIPQGPPPSGSTRTVTIEIWAVAINYVGGKSQTPKITATWTE